MGKCTVSFERASILKHMSDSDHADNDILTLMWSVDGQAVTPPHVFRLLDKSVLNPADAEGLWDGTELAIIVDSIDCPDSANVTLAAFVTNVSALA